MNYQALSKSCLFQDSLKDCQKEEKEAKEKEASVTQKGLKMRKKKDHSPK